MSIANLVINSCPIYTKWRNDIKMLLPFTANVVPRVFVKGRGEDTGDEVRLGLEISFVYSHLVLWYLEGK